MFSHGCVRIDWKCINRFTRTPQQLREFQFFLVFQYCALSVVFSFINVSGILAGFIYLFLFFCFWWHWEWTHSTTELWPSWRVLTQRISKSMFRELSKHPAFSSGTQVCLQEGSSIVWDRPLMSSSGWAERPWSNSHSINRGKFPYFAIYQLHASRIMKEIFLQNPVSKMKTPAAYIYDIQKQCISMGIPRENHHHCMCYNTSLHHFLFCILLTHRGI